MKHIKVVPCIGLLLLCAFIASVTIAGASVTELDVSPSVVLPGETLSISGKATPNEEVSLKSSFVISLPVSEGKYSRAFNGIYFPAGEKTFSVRAENIKNIRVSLLGLIPFIPVKYPLGGPQKATDGIATISISLPFSGMDVTGEKDVNVYGAALEDASSVILTTDMAIKVTADKNGDFILDLDTEGVPFGEFLIAAGGKEKTVVQIVPTKPKPTPTPRQSHDRDKEPVISPTPTMTPIIALTPSSGLKTSAAPTSSPGLKQTQTPESTPDQKQMATPESTPDQKQTVKLEPTPDQTQTTTPKPSPSPPKRLIPGFGAFFASAGLLIVAYLVLALRRK
ncbi:MAG: PGF-CTERM sorting domain-containing protein [Euryarchaeota archaeon]|nr:PGF-CTERM sorting domain-containing protein [Euryarchaeota archaeon]